jgi:sugar lactone lactonase YvrE
MKNMLAGGKPLHDCRGSDWAPNRRNHLAKSRKNLSRDSHGAVVKAAAILLSVAALAFAVQTKTWRQAEYSNFEAGTIKNLSLRSDGVLSLAPQFREVFDSSSAYLWAMAQDSAGNLYTGGGPGAKLYRISPGGEKKTLAEFEALEIHAIAINRAGQLFVATAPDGKVYKVPASGKPEVFYDPKTKYIWALAFNSKGDLLVATGDQGEIHRVTPEGKGSVFFRSEETHARSLAIDGKDNVIVGTEPGGLVIRVSPAGEGFVLYQTPKREITAVAIAKDGSIYAAGVGNKSSGAPSPAPLLTPAPALPPTTASGGGASIVVQRAAAPPPPTLGAPAAGGVSGGSEIYRIHPDGHPQRVWTHATDVVYALGFDAEGRTLAGAGNKGSIYRLDANSLYTVLLSAPPTQVTAFCAGRDGKIYAATGNIGKVYEIGPGLEREGTIESEVFDAGMFSTWGRLVFTADSAGGRVAVATRSGNLDRPAKNWSAWSSAITGADGARITSPPARFLQWKATLEASGGKSPQLESVEAAYLPGNVAPHIELTEITPPNYRFPAPSAALSSAPASLTLPALGRSSGRTTTAASSAESTTSPTMSWAKGSLGARWNASDENGDPLMFNVYIRGVKETGWKVLKEKVREKYLSFDSTAFPDGEYRLRITATDLPGNPPEQALGAELESDIFLIDNTPPHISGLKATRNGAGLNVRWKAADALSFVTKAEYSVDGGEWLVALPVTKLSDSKELDYDLTLNGVAAGEHTVAVRVQDDYENQSTDKAIVP